jgi:glycosyltransferase involved in cell wall biosynthesis
MKVVLISTFKTTGGAAIACKRLMKALQKAGMEVKLIVRDKTTDDTDVITVNASYLKRKINFIRFVWERFIIFVCNKFSKKNLFAVSIANTGTDISKLPVVKEADIIHLHWINQGFLSLKNIGQLVKTGKPIVWTMHDMWTFTGICHYAGDCTNYWKGCKSCVFLKKTSGQDLSTKIFNRKHKIHKNATNLSFVGCSNWIANCARQSALSTGINTICSIANPIDTQLYNVLPKSKARQKFNLPENKKLILFGAIKVTDERKGLKYMIDACNILTQKHPSLQQDLAIVVFGKNTDLLKYLFLFPVFCMNFVSGAQDMVALYNSADVFVIPSLEDNLPNTIMEAMACGTPCVGFNAGGIPEMIDHKVNGYVAEYKSAEDLATGIVWCLENCDNLSAEARKKALSHYSENIVAKKYIDLYNKLIIKCQKQI